MANFDTIAGAAKPAAPAIRHITLDDLWLALRRGFADFWDRPSHYVFIVLIFPIIGIFLGVWLAGANAWPLFYPLLAGFALVGPVAALGLYEMSRRKELGENPGWLDALHVLRTPAAAHIAVLGVVMLAIFCAWMMTAQALYTSLLGPTHPATFWGFAQEMLTTQNGWTMILVGNLVGFAFATLALAISVVAFPMLVDRNVSTLTAVETSIRAVVANPVPMAVWGIMVAGLLALGTIPFFLGLAIVLPWLGHATWHLYRRLVVHAP